MQKLLKIQIKLSLNTKDYKQTYNLSTILGQQGINIVKFINVLNESIVLKKINYKTPLNISISVFQDKTFNVFYKNFNSNFVLKHFFFFLKKKNVLKQNSKNLDDNNFSFLKIFQNNKILLNTKKIFFLYSIFKNLELNLEYKMFINSFLIFKNFQKYLNQIKQSYKIEIEK